MPQNPSTSAPPSNFRASAPKLKRLRIKPRLLAIGIAALLAVAALVIFVIMPLLSRGTQLFVNGEPYVYACSAFTQDDLADIFGSERSEHEFINEEVSLDVTGEKADVHLLELTGQDSVDSKCTYGLNVQNDARGESSSNLFEATITQYRDNKAARAAAQSRQPEQTKELPSFTGEDGYFVYTPASPEQLTTRPVAEAYLVRDNAVIHIKLTSLDRLVEDSLLQGLDEAVVRAATRIDNGDASDPTNFSGSYEYAGRKIVDICKAVDLSKLAGDMGQVDLKPTKIQDVMVSAVRSEEASEKVLQSACVLAFRTNEDKAAQEGKEITSTEQDSAYDRQFPHDLTLVVTSYDTAETAQGAIASIREELGQETNGPRAVDVRLGDNAFKFRRENTGTSSSSNYYYIQQDQFVYHFNVASVVQEEPFATEPYILNDEAAGKIFDLLSSAAK